MAAVALNALLISPVDPDQVDIYDGIALEALTAGAPLYLDPTTGKFGLADANAAGKQQFRGIASKSVGANQAVGVIRRGRIYGYTLTGNYDSLVYLSDTVGTLDTVAGTMTVPVGRVVPIADTPSAQTKVLYVEADWLTTWA